MICNGHNIPACTCGTETTQHYPDCPYERAMEIARMDDPAMTRRPADGELDAAGGGGGDITPVDAHSLGGTHFHHHIYVHSSKDRNGEAAEELGLQGEAYRKFLYLGYEHKLTFYVCKATGDGELVAVDDRRLE